MFGNGPCYAAVYATGHLNVFAANAVGLHLHSGRADGRSFGWQTDALEGGDLIFCQSALPQGNPIAGPCRMWIRNTGHILWNYNGGNMGLGTTLVGDVLPLGFTNTDASIFEIRSRNAGDVGLFLARTGGTDTGLQIWHDYSSGSSYFDNRYEGATGQMIFRVATKTAPTNTLVLISSGHAMIRIPTAAPDWSYVWQNFLGMWFDEGNNRIGFRVRTSGDTMKTGYLSVS